MVLDTRQARVQREDERLQAERRVKFKGTARVKLESLYFPKISTHELDVKHVKTLKEQFRTNGCRRLEVQNHIPAVIDQQQLDTALVESRVSAAELLSSPEYKDLEFPAGALECLHGRHRVQAGREFLPLRDQWWTVNIYLAGIFTSIRKRCF